MRRIREKIPVVRTVMVGDASAVEVLSAIRVVAAGEAVGPPRFSAAPFRGAAQQLAIRQNLQVRSGIGLPERIITRRTNPLGTYQPRNRFASEAFRTYREESRSPHSTQNQANSIESRSGNTATGGMAHPSPIYPLHCEALPRAEAAETR
jgi:hypothetical protein